MTNKLNFKQAMIAGITAAAVSTIINAVLFFIFHALGWITDDIFVQPDQPLTVVSVIIASIVPSLIASLDFSYLRNILKMALKYSALSPSY